MGELNKDLATSKEGASESQINYVVHDVTQSLPQEVEALLSKEVQTGHFLHGSNSNILFPTLEAKQANDSSKESGNKKALYATNNPQEAIFKAIVNKSRFMRELSFFTVGWDFVGGKIRMKVDPAANEILQHDYESCFSDGFVYSLDEKPFHQAADTSTELQSEDNQVPLKAYKVPGLPMAKEMMPKESIVCYSPEEMDQIKEHIKSQGIERKRQIAHDIALRLFAEKEEEEPMGAQELVERVRVAFAGNDSQEKALQIIQQKGQMNRKELEDLILSFS